MEAIFWLAVIAIIYQIFKRAPLFTGRSDDNRKKAEDGADNNTGEIADRTGRKKTNPFSGGSGSQEDPYLVSSFKQLDKIRYYRDSHFLQTANLNFSKYKQEQDWQPIGNEQKQFTGSFAGNGHKIFNLSINRPDKMYIGLFGFLAPGAEVSNVILRNAVVEGDMFVGILAGWNNGSIYRCHARGEITAFRNAGLLAGNNRGNIEESFTEGEIYAVRNSGGFVGWNHGSIKNCFSDIKVVGNKEAGGFAGSNYGDINCCYAVGEVQGDKRSGDFVGWNLGNARESFAVADEAHYRLKQRRSRQGKEQFSGWDFTSIWRTRKSTGLPVLQWYAGGGSSQNKTKT